MRPIFCLVLAATGGFGLTLATDYDAHPVLSIEAESRLEMHTTEFEITRDGEPMESRLGGEYESLDERRVVVLERVVESAEGVPMRVEREFQKVEGRAQRSIAGNDSDESLECPLDGVALRLHRDGDEVLVEVVSGEAPDAELLEGHLLELALDACLPDHAVEEKSTWELDDGALRRLLGLDVAPALFPPRERSGDDGPGWHRGRGGSRGFAAFSAGEWSGTATLVGTSEEHEGERCARIELELANSGELAEGGFGSDGGGGRAFEPCEATHALVRRATTFEVDLSGHMLFSLDSRRPLLLELEGDVAVVTDTTRELGESKIELFNRREGDFTYRVELSIVKDS